MRCAVFRLLNTHSPTDGDTRDTRSQRLCWLATHSSTVQDIESRANVKPDCNLRRNSKPNGKLTVRLGAIVICKYLTKFRIGIWKCDSESSKKLAYTTSILPLRYGFSFSFSVCCLDIRNALHICVLFLGRCAINRRTVNVLCVQGTRSYI